MYALDSCWGEVAWGMYVQDPAGTAWRVERRFLAEPGHAFESYELLSRDGRRVTTMQDGSTPVKILVPTSEEAIRTILGVLGGVVTTDDLPPPKGRTQKQTDNRIAKWVTHLVVMHGDWAESVGARVHNRSIDWEYAHWMHHAQPDQAWIPHRHRSWKA